MTHRFPSASLVFCSAAALCFAGLTFSAPALAQEAEADEEMDAADDDFSDMEEDEELLDDLEEEEPAAEEVGAEDSGEPISNKKTGNTQLLIGMRTRLLITPKFLINMFGVDGGRTVVVPGIGPEIGGYWGKAGDGFQVMFSPWYASYSLDQTPFKGSNDPDTAWEVIESDLKVWYVTVDAMWDHKLPKNFSFMVGGGFGLGFVAGDLRRNEAQQDFGGNPDIPADKDWPDLSLCPGATNTPECPADGNYDIVNGTSSDRWPVYPWINFQMGLRYQPVDEFVGRLDFGLGSSGFWVGLGADYSIFL